MAKKIIDESIPKAFSLSQHPRKRKLNEDEIEIIESLILLRNTTTIGNNNDNQVMINNNRFMR